MLPISSTKNNTQSGFSVLESLIVIGIIGVMAAVIVPSFFLAKQKNLLEDGQMTVIRALESARNRSTAGVGDIVNHGIRIHINESSITAFEGDDFASGEIGHTIFLPGRITIKQISENGNDVDDTDIVFSRLSGKLLSDEDVVIEIENPTTGEMLEIKITGDGMIIKE